MTPVPLLVFWELQVDFVPPVLGVSLFSQGEIFRLRKDSYTIIINVYWPLMLKNKSSFCFTQESVQFSIAISLNAGAVH